LGEIFDPIKQALLEIAAEFFRNIFDGKNHVFWQIRGKQKMLLRYGCFCCYLHIFINPISSLRGESICFGGKALPLMQGLLNP
jgi:hypothetical protein